MELPHSVRHPWQRARALARTVAHWYREHPALGTLFSIVGVIGLGTIASGVLWAVHQIAGSGPPLKIDHLTTSVTASVIVTDVRVVNTADRPIEIQSIRVAANPDRLGHLEMYRKADYGMLAQQRPVKSPTILQPGSVIWAGGEVSRVGLMRDGRLTLCVFATSGDVYYRTIDLPDGTRQPWGPEPTDLSKPQLEQTNGDCGTLYD